MAIAVFLESCVFGPSGFWTMAPLRYAVKFDPLLSLDCAPTPSTLAQSKERKGSNFAIWQPWEEESARTFTSAAAVGMIVERRITNREVSEGDGDGGLREGSGAGGKGQDDGSSR